MSLIPFEVTRPWKISLKEGLPSFHHTFPGVSHLSLAAHLQPRVWVDGNRPHPQWLFPPSERSMVFICNGCCVWGKEKGKRPTRTCLRGCLLPVSFTRFCGLWDRAHRSVLGGRNTPWPLASSSVTLLGLPEQNIADWAPYPTDSFYFLTVPRLEAQHRGDGKFGFW